MSALSDHILNHVDIVDLVWRYVSIKKSGTNYAGLCPFHSEKSPSFLVSPSKQIFKCFGCGAGGNAIKFIMDLERYDYGDAIKYFAQEYKINLEEFETKRQSSPEYQSEKEKTKRMMKLAQEFFVGSLANTNAYNYLTTKRGLSDELIVQLGLGYAPSQSQSLFAFFKQHGFSLDDLVSVGLAKIHDERKDYYAFFRDRLMIPIRDQLGNVIAFWARALQDGQEPKYLNSSDSIIYDKSSTLYGIDHLKQGIKSHKAIIIVEGYFDVIALTMAGMDIGVATCGTSLTDAHLKTLQRYNDNIYFLFDNDGAGINATLRWLTIAYGQWVYPKIIDLKTISPSLHLSISPKDIDDLVRDNPDASTQVTELMTQAVDGFQRACNHYLSHHDLHSPVDRKKILHGLFDLIYHTSSMSIQNLFLEQMSDQVSMDYALVRSQYRQYIKTEKKLFWRRTPAQIPSDSVPRPDSKLFILWALLADNYWQTLQIDTEWIGIVTWFISLIAQAGTIWLDEQSHIMIKIDGVLEPLDKEIISERQLRWEKELTHLGGDMTSVRATNLAKQVLVPYLHTLQKTALKLLSPTQKNELLLISGKLR